ncbi:putative HTH-type transcriptional regulator [subsurface metagenome]
MILSRSAAYAVRAMIDIATEADGGVARTREVARRQEIPPVFLTKIIQRLAQAGFLEAHRGAHGGVRLARPAAEITLRQIIEVMAGPLFMNYCLFQPGECPREKTCPVRDVWLEAQEKLLETLGSCTLAHLAERSKELCAKQTH